MGASAGIGEAFARSAVALGADVCVSARRLDKLEQLCSDLGSGHAVATRTVPSTFDVSVLKAA